MKPLHTALHFCSWPAPAAPAAPESDAFAPESIPGALPGAAPAWPAPPASVSLEEHTAALQEAYVQGTRHGRVPMLCWGFLAGCLTVATAVTLGVRAGL